MPAINRPTAAVVEAGPPIPRLVCFLACFVASAASFGNPKSNIAAATVPSEVIAERDRLQSSYTAKLQTLAQECDDSGLSKLADRVRNWPISRDPTRLYVFDLRNVVATDEVTSTSDTAKDHGPSIARWKKLRDEQAETLMALARRAVKQKTASLAFELVREVVRENPDHEQARKILGFIKHEDDWRTPFEIRQLRQGKVWHEKFGWLPKAHIERHEKGERFLGGRWTTADAEEQLQGDARSGRRIESEHYQLTTTAGLEAGVEMIRRLELLYDVWEQVFIRYVASEAQLAKAFQTQTSPLKESDKHKAVFYKSRAQYNAALQPVQPKIPATLGIYLGNTQTAYFFAGEEQEPGTVFHEGAHQLFQESRPVVHIVGQKHNFWVIEAVACYMESLDVHDGYVTLGGFDAGRAPAARHRLLVDNYYVPFAELTALGLPELQSREDIARLYSQSAGQAMFLIHAENGQYRDALTQYLIGVYSGRATPATLASLTGQSYEKLDEQYREFMETAVEDATAPADSAN